jgi:hypothetical protein
MTTVEILLPVEQARSQQVIRGSYAVGPAPDAGIRVPSLPGQVGELHVDHGLVSWKGAVRAVIGGLAHPAAIARLLRDREEVGIEDVVFRVVHEVPRPRTLFSLAQHVRVAARTGRASSALPRVTWLTGPDLGKSLSLVDEVTVVGRHPSCPVHLRDRFASRRHARLLFTRLGVTIEDLGSGNGLEVNGRPVSLAGLKSGDIVQVGATLLGYDAGSAPMAEPVPALKPPPPPAPAPGALAAPRSQDITVPGLPFPLPKEALP